MDTKTLLSFLHLIKPALVSNGGKRAEFFPLSLAVAKDLNVLLDIPHRLLPGLVTPGKVSSVSGCPEAFHRGVVITVAAAAHRGLHLELLQKVTAFP